MTASTTAGSMLLLGAAVAGERPDPEVPGMSGAAADRVDAAGHLDAADLELTSGHPRTHPWRGHPGRRIRHYTVHRGDTATGLAVRFHAWTDELLAVNHLGRHARLYVGQHLRIPVVVAAVRRARHHHATHHRAHHPKPHHRVHHRPHHRVHHRAHHQTHRRHLWTGTHASRATVRRVVARTAARHGVGTRLALAIAWQESGWQQYRVSSAGALGVMQVLPGTGRWMSAYAGHRLRLRHLQDNVTAGVLLIKVLRAEVRPLRAVAAYYQGLGSVQQHRHLYPSTRRYVRNVVAIRRALAHGWNPA